MAKITSNEMKKVAEIKVEVFKIPKNELVLTESIATGKWQGEEGEEFRFLNSLPGRSIIIEFRGEKYLVDSTEIIKKALEAVTEGEEK